MNALMPSCEADGSYEKLINLLNEEYEDVIDYYDVIYPNDYFCSAIIHFKSEEELTKFQRKYNGQTFFLPNGETIKLNIMFCINQRFNFEN